MIIQNYEHAVFENFEQVHRFHEHGKGFEYIKLFETGYCRSSELEDCDHGSKYAHLQKCWQLQKPM